MGIIRFTPGSIVVVIERMEAPETIGVTTPEVSCDGGVGPLGHPLVYLRIGAEGWVECPYCDRRFVLDDAVASTAGD